MSTIDFAAEYPHLSVQIHGMRDGQITNLAARVSQQPDDAARLQLVALLSRLRDVPAISVGATTPELPEVDFRWVLDAVRDLLARERVFLSGARLLTLGPVSCAWLGTWNRITCFQGVFRSVLTLDLRDERADIAAATFPDVETLILRPRHAEWGVPWAREALAAAGSFPVIRELRCPENNGDALFAALVDSPLLPRLRRIDFTDNVTNASAELLHTHLDRFMHLDELWLGSDDRRDRIYRFKRLPGEAAPDYPPGTLEIDDAWRSRLEQKLGKRMRYEPRPDHPDL